MQVFLYNNEVIIAPSKAAYRNKQGKYNYGSHLMEHINIKRINKWQVHFNALATMATSCRSVGGHANFIKDRLFSNDVQVMSSKMHQTIESYSIYSFSSEVLRISMNSLNSGDDLRFS